MEDDIGRDDQQLKELREVVAEKMSELEAMQEDDGATPETIAAAARAVKKAQKKVIRRKAELRDRAALVQRSIDELVSEYEKEFAGALDARASGNKSRTLKKARRARLLRSIIDERTYSPNDSGASTDGSVVGWGRDSPASNLGVDNNNDDHGHSPAVSIAPSGGDSPKLPIDDDDDDPHTPHNRKLFLSMKNARENTSNSSLGAEAGSGSGAGSEREDSSIGLSNVPVIGIRHATPDSMSADVQRSGSGTSAGSANTVERPNKGKGPRGGGDGDGGASVEDKLSSLTFSRKGGALRMRSMSAGELELAGPIRLANRNHSRARLPMPPRPARPHPSLLSPHASEGDTESDGRSMPPRAQSELTVSSGTTSSSRTVAGMKRRLSNAPRPYMDGDTSPVPPSDDSDEKGVKSGEGVNPATRKRLLSRVQSRAEQTLLSTLTALPKETFAMKANETDSENLEKVLNLTPTEADKELLVRLKSLNPRNITASERVSLAAALRSVRKQSQEGESVRGDGGESGMYKPIDRTYASESSHGDLDHLESITDHGIELVNFMIQNEVARLLEEIGTDPYASHHDSPPAPKSAVDRHLAAYGGGRTVSPAQQSLLDCLKRSATERAMASQNDDNDGGERGRLTAERLGGETRVPWGLTPNAELLTLLGDLQEEVAKGALPTAVEMELGEALNDVIDDLHPRMAPRMPSTESLVSRTSIASSSASEFEIENLSAIDEDTEMSSDDEAEVVFDVEVAAEANALLRKIDIHSLQRSMEPIDQLIGKAEAFEHPDTLDDGMSVVSIPRPPPLSLNFPIDSPLARSREYADALMSSGITAPNLPAAPAESAEDVERKYYSEVAAESFDATIEVVSREGWVRKSCGQGFGKISRWEVRWVSVGFHTLDGYDLDLTGVMALAYKKDPDLIQWKRVIPLKGCTVSTIAKGKKFQITLMPGGTKKNKVTFTCNTADEMREWHRAICQGILFANSDLAKRVGRSRRLSK